MRWWSTKDSFTRFKITPGTCWKSWQMIYFPLCYRNVGATFFSHLLYKLLAHTVSIDWICWVFERVHIAHSEPVVCGRCVHVCFYLLSSILCACLDVFLHFSVGECHRHVACGCLADAPHHWLRICNCSHKGCRSVARAIPCVFILVEIEKVTAGSRGGLSVLFNVRRSENVVIRPWWVKWRCHKCARLSFPPKIKIFAVPLYTFLCSSHTHTHKALGQSFLNLNTVCIIFQTNISM